jgi:hypothetical protein
MLGRTAADWSKVRQRKLVHWVAQYRKNGPLGALRAADDLRAHVVSVLPDWPDARTRRADWEHHRNMRLLFDRMAHALDKKLHRKTASRSV